MPILEVKNIRKKFGQTEVLKGISFTLEKGEVLAIIGSSGSGKTTLLRCLNYLETPDEGTVSVAGETYFDKDMLKTLSDRHRRMLQLHFGLVFQSFNLFPQYNVTDNLTLAAKLLRTERIQHCYKEKKSEAALEYKKTRDKVSYRDTLAKIKEEYKTARAALPAELEVLAKDLLAKVGLSDKARSYPWQLSGGQQQRVAIARALALSPDILCFDEPTSALDPELTDEVLGVIRGLKSGDSTMIVVTHEMRFAKNVADKIIFMSGGVIEEMGTAEELFENPKSEALKHFLAKTAFGKEDEQ